jgi:hypothetical protein
MVNLILFRKGALLSGKLIQEENYMQWRNIAFKPRLIKLYSRLTTGIRGSQGMQNSKYRAKKEECVSFFIAERQGTIHYADDLGHIAACINMPTEINSMRYESSMGILTVFTNDLMLSHFVQTPDGKLSTQVSVGDKINLEATY